MNPDWAARLADGGCEDCVCRAVRLATTTAVTPDRIRQAVAECLHRSSVAAADVMTVLERGARNRLADPAAVTTAAAALLEHGAVVRVAGHDTYPLRLADAWPELGAPLWIFTTGNSPAVGRSPTVAVVGTRQPTLDGARTARELGRLLGRCGVTVVSGMARGIDQAAHLGALDVDGVTVGVLGTGFGVDYPRRDGPLRDAVARSGGLVTELLPGAMPTKRGFLWRNRIIAGLADVTVVVEGRARSGALHTARMAAAQGRDVMAVPGSLHEPASHAPLALIRDGAIAVTRLEDVPALMGLAAPGAARPPSQLSLPPAMSGTARQLLPLLGAVPAPPHSLAAALQRPVSAVLAGVGELAAHGLAVATPRGIVRGRSLESAALP